MYRKPTPKQQAIKARKLEAMRRGKDRARLARGERERPPDLPELRRVVTITDHDTGEPVTHVLELRKTRRVDTYAIAVDGQPWRCGGWSAALAMLRKAYPRVPSARAWTDFQP